MSRKTFETGIRLERERERESNSSKNIATQVAGFVTFKSHISKKWKVSYV